MIKSLPVFFVCHAGPGIVAAGQRWLGEDETGIPPWPFKSSGPLTARHAHHCYQHQRNYDQLDSHQDHNDYNGHHHDGVDHSGETAGHLTDIKSHEHFQPPHDHMMILTKIGEEMFRNEPTIQV